MCERVTGTAMVIVFRHDFRTIATGLDIGGSEDGRGHTPKRKFFGGKIKDSDSGNELGKMEIARACMLRELYSEAGLTREHLEHILFFHERQRDGRDNSTGARMKYSQFFFLAVAKEGTTLPDEVEEGHEMTDRRFIDVVTVLRSWRLPRNDPNRFNPVHAIALARSLICLRDRKVATTVKSFADVLIELDQFGIQLETEIQEIEVALKNREV